jgi:hypothetical protein
MERRETMKRKVKSLKWFEENCRKNRLNWFEHGEWFTESMTQYCEMEIEIVDGYYNGWCFSEWMLEPLHLCAACKLSFASCNSKDVDFGNGIGNDNVIQCAEFKL